MAIRRIEVPIFGRINLDGLLDSARHLANRFTAEIQVHYIRPSAADAALYDAGFGFASASLIEQMEKEGLLAAEAAHKRFDAWRDGQADMPRILWHVEDGQAATVVARTGVLADVILLQRAGSKDAAIDEVFEAAVFGAGRLAMLIDSCLSENFLDHVLIAWNESREASRAVAQSMPFLAKAGKVSIFAESEAGDEAVDLQGLIDYLALHGVQAGAVATGSTGGSLGTDLLQTSDREGVTLLVMGAYTHSRVRQMLFGGATQQLLTTPGFPVLFAH